MFLLFKKVIHHGTSQILGGNIRRIVYSKRGHLSLCCRGSVAVGGFLAFRLVEISGLLLTHSRRFPLVTRMSGQKWAMLIRGHNSKRRLSLDRQHTNAPQLGGSDLGIAGPFYHSRGSSTT